MTQSFRLLTMIALVFLSMGAFAMKPGPFDDVKYVDPATKFSVQASAGPGGNSLHAAGPTNVYDAQGKLLWTMPDFPGRHELRLSPDGKILIFIGNLFFTSLIQLSPKEVIAAVYQEGKLAKSIVFSDLISEDPDKLAKRKRVPEMGGGWVPRKEFISDIQVDWSHRELAFKIYDGSLKKVSF